MLELEEDGGKLRAFLQETEATLASARSSLLIAAQSCDASALEAARRSLLAIREHAGSVSRSDVARRTVGCISAVEEINSPFTAHDVYPALDLLNGIESALFEMALGNDEFLDDVIELVDSSLGGDGAKPDLIDECFDIDDETLEIFRTEAEGLLQDIRSGITGLSGPAITTDHIWEIRRSAHTFKGAAAIVGSNAASKTAHQMEDLLDHLVEQGREPTEAVISFLSKSAQRLEDLLAAREPEPLIDLETAYGAANESLKAYQPTPAISNPMLPAPTGKLPDQARATTAPIVRVSLERLDELIKLSRSIVVSHKALAERCSELQVAGVNEIADLLNIQNGLTSEIEAKLLNIRMVKFGTLETRLSRAINVTSADEQKKAYLELINGETEIDTQMMDALVEPLLHLLKNAVVHGIERPETRRLIGKNERGRVCVRIENREDEVVLTVSDDGAGIATGRLREKAVQNGIIDSATANRMSETDTLGLIFDRGLTTVEKVDLNAGRGVGMSIVKESVEGRGGRVEVRSTAQAGTTFTIHYPISGSGSMPDQRPAVVRSATGRKLCLLVDDSPSVRLMTSRILVAAGFTVITAENGMEAVEMLLSHTVPDMIISDVEMPEMDGWGLLGFLKGDPTYSSIPVVIVTSLKTEEHRKRALLLGANGYVVKPFGVNDIECVTTAMASVSNVLAACSA